MGFVIGIRLHPNLDPAFSHWRKDLASTGVSEVSSLNPESAMVEKTQVERRRYELSPV